MGTTTGGCINEHPYIIKKETNNEMLGLNLRCYNYLGYVFKLYQCL